MHQALQLGHHSVAKPGQLGIAALGQPTRPADQMRQAGLPAMEPVMVHAIPVTHQNPCPALNQRFKRDLAPAHLDREQRHRRVGHHPQPDQDPVLIPCGLIDVIDRCAPGLPSNRLVMGCDRFRDSIHHALNRAPADGHPQDRCTKLLHRAAAAPLTPRQLPDEGRQPGPIPIAVLGRQLGFKEAATSGTMPLVQYDMRHGHLDLGQLDHLVRIVGGRRGNLLLPTGTGVRRDRDDLRGLQQGLAMPSLRNPSASPS